MLCYERPKVRNTYIYVHMYVHICIPMYICTYVHSYVDHNMRLRGIVVIASASREVRGPGCLVLGR
jgi:hypothetical protein